MKVNNEEIKKYIKDVTRIAERLFIGADGDVIDVTDILLDTAIIFHDEENPTTKAITKVLSAVILNNEFIQNQDKNIAEREMHKAKQEGKIQ